MAECRNGGGLAIAYLVWPLLALSVPGLWYLLRLVDRGRTFVFGCATLVMMGVTWLIHPSTDRIAELSAPRLPQVAASVPA
ncbi:hypothetical protein [Pseudaestuariivita atlantica]|uniref:Uncharacterized protein n=1 Tax=Pseudaestuariivita atlantica TaxID=1317121 RepID=A0A0L1JL09_9RHOB|nr:hypothetical protein [Pseudaestuariivita atlantica]KNG92108.1 hypothetical protein ATO11_19105 [Pseudaestuariivita atlantica]